MDKSRLLDELFIGDGSGVEIKVCSTIMKYFASMYSALGAYFDENRTGLAGGSKLYPLYPGLQSDLLMKN